MLKNSKFFYLLVLVLFSITYSYAQKTERHRAPSYLHEKNLEDLDLTDSQRTKVAAIKAESKQKIESIKLDANIENKRKAIKNVRISFHEAFEEILSPEQMAKYEVLKSEIKVSREKKREAMKAFYTENKMAIDAMKKEMKAYKKKEIKPALLKERLAFEDKLSTKDKVLLDEIRKDCKAFSKETRQGTNADKSKPEAKKHKGNNKMDKYFNANPQKKVELLDILDTYSEELKIVDQRLSPKREVWDKDLKAIKEKHLAEKSENLKGKRSIKTGVRTMEFSERKANSRTIKFLLMKINERADE